jgi:hypothetical protein
MPWDAELERLTAYVHRHFGEEGFDMAMSRALRTFTADAVFSRNAVGAGHPFGGLVSSQGHPLSLVDFYELLRVELERISRVQ